MRAIPTALTALLYAMGCAAARAPTVKPVERRPPVREALAGAESELDRAERRLESAAGDCGAACEALGSMDREAGSLCRDARSEDDRARCVEATNQVLAGRGRVRDTCGACPAGPTLDGHAGVPSA